MNSRERVIETLNHRQTDRVAIDLGATNATGISAVVYAKLRRLLGLEATDTVIFDVMQQLAEVEPDVLSKLGGDVVMLRRLSPTLGMPVRRYIKGRGMDGSAVLYPDTYHPVVQENGDMELYKVTDDYDEVHPYRLDVPREEYEKGKMVARCPKGFNAFARMYHPLSQVETIEELDRYAFPEMREEETAFLTQEAKRLYETTDKAICGVFGGNIFEMGQLYWGYETYFMNIGAEKEFTMNFLERRADAFMRDLKKYLDAVGSYIQIINFYDDLGTQNSLLISPAMYREMIKPFHKRMYGYVREHYPNIKVLLHSCGAIYDLIPDFIEAGVQALNPVQITAEGMDPARLKKNFGSDVAFWGGGVDTQFTLNSGSIQQVTAMVREMIRILAPGGGYVFSQVHNIESCVPAENVLAAFETALQCAKY
ncbi:MAG: uroporphyrinogen decarboxylase family protein [Clostridia bacterium]|nr:uroporphyrinogen decarboxylase family protein [Clostridia bacterium]MDR3643764.1 uroporphyrinogen decarboxylase family protein [Clostridia bacterium]